MAKRPRTPREDLIADTIRRFKRRRLHSGQGKNKGKPPKGEIVQKRRQAVAIALSMAAKKYGPYRRKTLRRGHRVREDYGL